ncbi:hypothetical protein [Streptomyces sp. 4N124]|uniref:hypothetical protein n=1 Tax=Streptomyces sp. 4N124 TaxID=3457420 RepID=UPI003FD3FECB
MAGYVDRLLGGSMADLATWVGAVGGVVGALGGPAGLWAAYQQRQQIRRDARRREALRHAPPPSVLSDLLVVKAEIREVRTTYRDSAWWDSTPAKDSIRRLAEAEPALGTSIVAGVIGVVLARYSHASSLVAAPYMDEGQRMSRVAGQREVANRLDQSLDQAIQQVQDAIHAAQA